MQLSCPDSFWQFGLMSLSPNAHRCVVGFRASFMSTVSSRSQHLILQLIWKLHQLLHIALRAWPCMWWCICPNFLSLGSCLFHQPLKKLEHCGISPQSRPRSHLRQVYFARYCLTFSKSCRAQKNRVDIAELLPQLSCLPNSPRNALREQQLAHSGYILLLCNGVKCDLPDAAGVGRRFKEQASIGLAHVQGHGRSVYKCHRNHQEWLQSNRLPWTYLIVPTKLELWGLDSL